MVCDAPEYSEAALAALGGLEAPMFLQATHLMHGGRGQDRVFGQALMKHFPAFGRTGRYPVRYCLGGNPGSVTAQFLEHGDAVTRQRYHGRFPWARGAGSESGATAAGSSA